MGELQNRELVIVQGQNEKEIIEPMNGGKKSLKADRT